MKLNSRKVGTLRRALQPEKDERTQLRELGQQASLSIDTAWDRAGDTAPGPIDVVDFFSGCGGMSAGFHALNGLLPCYRIAAAVDIDQVANRTYQANLGVTPSNESVANLAKSMKRLEPLRDSLRENAPLVLIGCAPCQGFSSHRNAAGQGDDRNNLFLAFARIASRLKPDAVVIENVPELLTDRYWQYVESAKRTLKSAGYFVHLSVHNLAGFGVPQARFRALMLAMRKPFEPPAPFLNREQFISVRETIGDLPSIPPGTAAREDPMHVTAGHRSSTLETIRAVPKDGGSRPDHVGPECLRRAKARQGRGAYDDVYGRLYWDRPAITITHYARNPASGRYIHPEQDRGLSIREAALLQGFPRNYRFHGTLDPCFRQIGNAVPPKFAAYLAAHIIGEFLSDDTKEFDPGITRSAGPSFSRLIPALKAGHRAA